MVYKRRPLRPPFLRVESDGIGVTSSTNQNEHLLETNLLRHKCDSASTFQDKVIVVALQNGEIKATGTNWI